ncbi:DKNYY domain-containing protein [Burkholderia anthina]|uniref:DKNYY domain-containing protein n=1 Tax=Burkholderia anthina TaxID=179879 RepID=UPI00158BBAFF|nr:DKNYY domain-containing protein [Burkholderia anthina]
MPQPLLQDTNHPDYAIAGDTVIRRADGLPLWGKDGKPLPIERPQAFRCIGGRWFTDGVHVIVQAQLGSAMVSLYYYRIEDADLDTFEILNQRYARDARQAYYITGRTIRTRSPHAFRPLVYETWNRPDDAHGVTFEMREHAYLATDDESIYMNGRRINGSHGASAIGFPGGYFADANRVYYYGRPKDIDRESFLCGPDAAGYLRCTDRIGPIESGERQTVQETRLFDEWHSFFTMRPALHDYWWHRRRQPAAAATVRFRDATLTGFDPATFAARETLFDFGAIDWLCGDAHGIHWAHRTCAEMPVELTRFSDQPIDAVRVLGKHYFTDGATVFYAFSPSQPQPLRGADPAAFRVLSGGWARDATRAFHLGVVKKSIDPDRLHVEGSYAWDGERLFCDGKPLQVDVPASELRVLHPTFLRAGDKLFFGRRPVSTKRVHLPTLEFIDDDFARDRKHAYIVGHVSLVEIDGADPASFRVVEPGTARDDTRRYDARTLRDATAPRD